MKKVHRAIKFNSKSSVETINWYESRAKKAFFKLMNNSVFDKTEKNVGKYRNIKLVANKKGKNYLLSKPNYHTKKNLSEKIYTRPLRYTNIRIEKNSNVLDLVQLCETEI